MGALQRMILTLVLAAICSPAWSATFNSYTIPGTSLTVDIDVQFNKDQVTTMLNTLSLFPVEQIKDIKNIEFHSSPDRSYITGDTISGSILIYATNESETVREVARLSVGVGLFVYFTSLSPADQGVWNAIPGRTASPSDDFGTMYFNEYYLNSYGFLDSAFTELKNKGDSTSLASLFLVASLFANPATGKISTYCQSFKDGCGMTGFNHDNFTWDHSGISFGDYKFLLNDNNELIGVKQGASPVIALKTPIPALPPSVITRFTPSELVQPPNPSTKIEIRETIDLNYRFLPHEKDQIRAVIAAVAPQSIEGSSTCSN